MSDNSSHGGAHDEEKSISIKQYEAVACAVTVFFSCAGLKRIRIIGRTRKIILRGMHAYAQGASCSISGKRMSSEIPNALMIVQHQPAGTVRKYLSSPLPFSNERIHERNC